jgi:hypothetical protein
LEDLEALYREAAQDEERNARPGVERIAHRGMPADKADDAAR